MFYAPFIVISTFVQKEFLCNRIPFKNSIVSIEKELR